MRPGRFFWKLFLGNAALMVIILVACTLLIGREFEELRQAEITRELRAYVASVAVLLKDRVNPVHLAELRRLVHDAVASHPHETRLTVISPEGRVWADSQADPDQMDSHADRPEVIDALATGSGAVRRWSHTVARHMQYVAVRMDDAGTPRAVLRAGIPESYLLLRGQPGSRLAVTIALIGGVMMLVLALGLASLWSRRIARITEATLRMLRDNMSEPIAMSGRDEVALLARSINSMRDRQVQQLSLIEGQNRRFASILAELREGVVMLDPDAKIRLVNPAAVRLLDMFSPRRDGSFDGVPYEQCIPHHDVQELLRDVMSGASEDDGAAPAGGVAVERAMQIHGRGGVVALLARAVPIPPVDQDGSDAGQLLVFTDVTHLTRTIQMKSDFVANASHELRTPLSAMRAALETLRTMDEPGSHPQASRFFDMLERQLARMEAMVMDLLDLSRVESPGARFLPDAVRLTALLEELEESFAKDIAEKQLRWEADIAPQANLLYVGPELMRMALRNLVENAIRFTGPGGWVRVTARRDGRAICIEVADNGCGIPPDDQARVFERFYQVERSRSGAQRGTGLGLSIVRHAVTAMSGEVELRSTPGKGTTVRIMLPPAKQVAIKDI